MARLGRKIKVLPKHIAVANAIVAGQSPHAAMVSAGYSTGTAQNGLAAIQHDIPALAEAMRLRAAQVEAINPSWIRAGITYQLARAVHLDEPLKAVRENELAAKLKTVDALVRNTDVQVNVLAALMAEPVAELEAAAAGCVEADTIVTPTVDQSYTTKS